MTTAKDEIKQRGWEIKYVPHDVIEDYNACYRVEFDDEVIYPPAADDLGIPLNEIWISERWQKYEKFILYHELQEIKYRAQGYSVEEAHEKAERDEIERWKDNPRWLEMNQEWDEGRAHLPFPE